MSLDDEQAVDVMEKKLENERLALRNLCKFWDGETRCDIDGERIELKELPYPFKEYEPVMSKGNMQFHYD